MKELLKKMGASASAFFKRQGQRIKRISASLQGMTGGELCAVLAVLIVGLLVGFIVGASQC